MHLTDIHCHILPMVDDGPKSSEEAERILKEASEQGVKRMIATPHFRPEMFEPSMTQVAHSYRYMREKAREYDVRLKLGCECYRCDELIQALDERKRLTMANGKYVLVEFSSHDLFSTFRRYIHDLLNHGYRPIIAHMERYNVGQSLDSIRELKELGAYIQINAGSVLGEDGWKIKRLCHQLMKEDLVDFIASDTHNMKHRKMNLKKCAAYVKRKMGKKYAQRIFVENPADIWKNR